MEEPIVTRSPGSDTRPEGHATPQPEGHATYRHGVAWVGLSLALALHVADEALNGFLSFYNPMARRIREAVPLVPLPTFEFEWWLAGLIAAVTVSLAVSVFVFRGRRWTIPASYV